MPKPKWNLNTIYISERLQESLRPISRCAMTTVVAPMGYGKTTAVNWYLGGARQGGDAAHHPHQRVFRQPCDLLEKRAGGVCPRGASPSCGNILAPRTQRAAALLMDDLCHDAGGRNIPATFSLTIFIC